MPTTPPLQYPPISVVIPMYNAEKYIGACLTSLLNQKFKNFEVIVVDDGSTDNSCAVVESFIPKFDGRINLLHMGKNTGGPAAPANKGVNFSRGKYIHVMDSDDLLTDNSYEVLFNLAENYDADLVCMDLGVKVIKNNDSPFPNQEDVEVVGWHGGPFVDKPTLESDDIKERVKKISRNGVGWTVWEKFVRRDFLMENEIKFVEIRLSHDLAWVMQTFCLAKRILTIPDLVYIFRPNSTSLTATKRTPEKYLDAFLTSHIKGMKALCDFFDKHKFFQDNPQCQTELLEFWEHIHYNTVRKMVSTMPPYELYGILKKIFTERFGEYGNLIAYLCNSSNFLQFRLNVATQYIGQLENYLKEIQKK